MSRHPAGSDVGLTLPDGATVLAANPTPRPETGLGKWGISDVVRALQSGVRPDGRVLSAVMPWADHHKMTGTDARASRPSADSLRLEHRVPSRARSP